MKLYKVEGNKAKASTIAKQRVKTPFKGEVMLKPAIPKKINNIKKESDSKKNSLKSKGNSLKRNNKTPGKNLKAKK